MSTIISNKTSRQLIIFHGVSGVGKTEALWPLVSDSKYSSLYELVHPIGHLYRYLEWVYNKDPYTLQRYTEKYQPINSEKGLSFQNLLEEIYFLARKYDPSFSCRGWRKDLGDLYLNTPHIAIVTSMRNAEEVEVIKSIQHSFNLKVLLVRMYRELVTGISTDTNVELIQDLLVKEIPSDKLTFVEAINSFPTKESWAMHVAEDIVIPWTLGRTLKDRSFQVG